MTIHLAHEFDTITGILGDDHDRLDQLLDETFELVETDPELARRRFGAFAAGLRRHIEVEDQLLFTAFERATGMREVGPTAIMRREHREIEHRLEQIAEALEPLAPNADAVGGEIGALRALLADHNHREELILYPACDRMLAAADVRAVRDALEKA